MRFKDNLRKQRTKANLSQESLAEKMSVSRQTISKWENGDTYPSTEHILMLAKILDCSMDNLIDHDPTNTEDQELVESAQIAPKRRNYIYWMVGAIATLAIVLLGFGISSYNNASLDSDLKINDSKVAVFDSIVDGSLDDAITMDGYTKKKVVGYGITEADGTFYVKCDVENDGTGKPCSAIIYFCEKDGKYSYKCQYLDDPDYLPKGEYYKVG